MNRKKLGFFFFGLFFLTLAFQAEAQVPNLLEYEGYLEETIWTTSITSTTLPVTGNRTMQVKLYDAAANGTMLYSENIGTIMVDDGQFYFQYGQNGTSAGGAAGIVSALQTGGQHWLALTVNGTEQPTRERLISVPFSLRSADSQKNGEDLGKVVNAVGKMVEAFGGNSTNLMSNPAGTIATMAQNAKNMLEVVQRFRVISLSGNLSFGNNKGPKTFTISNTGVDRLEVRGINYPSGFSGNTWSGTLVPGGAQQISVTFTPANSQPYAGAISVASNAMSGTPTIPVSGQGTSLMTLTGNMAFGNVTMNLSKKLSYKISNSGTIPLTISGITYPDGFTGNWTGTIAPGGFQLVEATFSPTAVKSYGGFVSVSSNADGGGVLLAISGKGAPIMQMISVKGGKLPSGSLLANQTVSDFQIGKYEVTWGEWKEVRDWAVANGYTDLDGKGYTSPAWHNSKTWDPSTYKWNVDPPPSFPEGTVDDHPVLGLTWFDAVKWCNAKSQKEGLLPVYSLSGAIYKTGEAIPSVNTNANGYRLPIESEWEWAARGGIKSSGYIYSGGNNVNSAGACYASGYIGVVTTSAAGGSDVVGSYSPNELSIYDMSGNAWEWCFDSSSIDQSQRQIRGGHFFLSPPYHAINFRFSMNAFSKSQSGFRLARKP